MIYLDLETTSLQGDIGIIVTIGFILPNGEMKLFFADKPEKEKEVIQQTIEILKDFEEPIIIWYSGFDIPFLVTRAIACKLNISEIYGFRIIDLCKLVQENLRLTSYKLDDVCKFFGVEKDINNTGKDVQSLYISWLSGDTKAREQIITHCSDDLKALRAIFSRLEPYAESWLRKTFKASIV